MIARTHDVAALTLLMVVVILHPPVTMTVATALAAVLANQIGGIAPDIDQPTAPLWRNLPVGHYMGKVFGMLVGGHRFICHSLLGLAAFAVLARLALAYLSPLMPRIDTGFVWVAFVVGMVSHLVMDMLTKEGVPLLLPIPFKFGFPPIKAWRVTTGKWVEKLVVLPALIVLLIWLSASHYNTLASIIQNHLVK